MQMLRQIKPILAGFFIFSVLCSTVSLNSFSVSLAHATGNSDTGNGTPEPEPFDDTELKAGICDLFELIEGDLGMLLAVVAGIGAIVASVFGAYRATNSFIVVALAAFIIRAMVSLWFVLPEEECGTSRSLAEGPRKSLVDGGGDDIGEDDEDIGEDEEDIGE